MLVIQIIWQIDYLHNPGKGAKYTKGKIWKLIYFKKFFKKKSNVRRYKLKNYKLRKKLNLIILMKNIKYINWWTKKYYFLNR